MPGFDLPAKEHADTIKAPPWRVCLISHRFPPDEGGVAVSTLRNAKLLSSAGIHVHVCVMDSRLPDGTTTDETMGKVAVHRVGGTPSVDGQQEWFANILRLHRRYRFDLLHAFYVVPAGYIAVLAARSLGLPVVVSARGNDVDRLAFDERRFGMLLWTLQHASAVTAVSRELKQKVSALADGCPVHFVANSVDTEVFRPGERKRELLESLKLDGLYTLLFSGEARRKKGLAILLQAFALLPRELPSNLILAGGLREEDQPIVDRFLARHETVAARLRLLPYLPTAELIAYYNLADIVVMPSLQDGMPNALLEAMACGRPVIASPVGGIGDVVSDGIDGFLVPPDDPRLLAKAIERLIEMPEDRQRAGQRARKTVQARFSHQVELAANMEVYRTVMRNT